MRERRRFLWAIPCILVILLVWSMTSVSAEPIPDLKGSWEPISLDMYSPSDGFMNGMGNQGPYSIIKQDGNAFAGNSSYYDSDVAIHVTHFFPAVLSPDGRTYFKDETGNGISFGELVSDHELYNYMLLADRGPMAIVSHMVKAGTDSSPAKPVPDLTGVWNLTHNRKNAVSTSGLMTIKEQKGRIWNGTEEIRDENGTMIEEPVVGTIGESGRQYAVSKDGAYMLGSLTGNKTIDRVFLIPGDNDGTFVVNRWMTRDETAVPKSELSYPDIAGDWKIDDRKVIQDGNITDKGPVSSEWVSYSNQSGRFFTATRHTQEIGDSKNRELSGIFRTPDEAYLTSAGVEFVQYQIINNSSIEAIVNLKDGKSILNMDMLTRKQD